MASSSPQDSAVAPPSPATTHASSVMAEVGKLAVCASHEGLSNSFLIRARSTTGMMREKSRFQRKVRSLDYNF
jgi:hypothetical protein